MKFYLYEIVDKTYQSVRDENGDADFRKSIFFASENVIRDNTRRNKNYTADSRRSAFIIVFGNVRKYILSEFQFFQ